MFYLHRDLYRNILSSSTRLYPELRKFLRSMSTRPARRALAPRASHCPGATETRNVCNPFNHRPACGHQEGDRILSAFQRLLGWDRALFRLSRRQCKPSRARRSRTAGHRPRTEPDRSGGPRFHDRSRLGENVMRASSAALCAAIGPRADGRRRASTAEAAAWS